MEINNLGIVLARIRRKKPLIPETSKVDHEEINAGSDASSRETNDFSENIRAGIDVARAYGSDGKTYTLDNDHHSKLDV